MSDIEDIDARSEIAAQNFGIWKHYEDRIAAVKESFNRTVSLLLAFAASLLAWGAQHAINWNTESDKLLNVPLVLIIAAGGIAITRFGIYIANDAAIHVASNMIRANRAARLVPQLAAVVAPVQEPSASEPSLDAMVEKVHICRQARLIIMTFGAIFGIGVVAALVQLCVGSHA